MNSLLSPLIVFQENYLAWAILLTALIKSSAILFLAAFVCRLLSNRPAKIRSSISRAAFTLLFVLLLLQWQGPWESLLYTVEVEKTLSPSLFQEQPLTANPIETPSPSISIPSPNQVPTIAQITPPQRISLSALENLLPTLWFGIGLLLLVLKFIRASLAFLGLRKTSLPADPFLAITASKSAALLTQPIPELYFSTALTAPLLTGWLKPIIHLPPSSVDWSPQKLEAVFLHELAHWKRRDIYWQAIASCVQCLWWWNPLAWIALGKLKAEDEKAADEEVIRHQEEAADYAQILLEIAKDSLSLSRVALGIPMLGRSQLEQRIRNILSNGSLQVRLGFWGYLLIVLLVLGVLACGGWNLVSKESVKIDSASSSDEKLKLQAVDSQNVLNPESRNKEGKAALKSLELSVHEEDRSSPPSSPDPLLLRKIIDAQKDRFEKIKSLQVTFTFSDLGRCDYSWEESGSFKVVKPTESIAYEGTLYRIFNNQQEKTFEGDHLSQTDYPREQLLSVPLVQPFLFVAVTGGLDDLRALHRSATWVTALENLQNQDAKVYKEMEGLPDERVVLYRELRGSPNGLTTTIKFDPKKDLLPVSMVQTFNGNSRAEYAYDWVKVPGDFWFPKEIRFTTQKDGKPPVEYVNTTDLDSLKINQPFPTDFFSTPGSLEGVTEVKTPAETAPVGKVILEVTDEKGNPVPNATIKPYGLRTTEEESSHYGWVKDGKPDLQPQDLKTNAEGKATLTYPLTIYEGLHTGQATVLVESDDFCLTGQDINVKNPKAIVLQKGTLLTVEVSKFPEGGEGKIAADLFDNSFRLGSYQWKRDPSGKSVSTRLLPGDYGLRAVAFAADNKTWFAEPQWVHLNGEAEKKIDFTLKPGISVSGKLVMPPGEEVRNGKIMVEVITPFPAQPSYKNSWSTSAKVNSDGTFVLDNLPPWGELGIVALADGFISKNPDMYAPSLRSYQKFLLDPAKPINVLMEKSGTAMITVLKPDGQPLEGARVSFSPNRRIEMGTTLLDSSFETAASLRYQGEPPNTKFGNRTKESFSSPTDAKGIAVISNLPVGNEGFNVDHSDYEMPINFSRNRPAPYRGGSILITTEGSSEKVTMEAKGTTSLSEAILRSKDQPDKPALPPGDNLISLPVKSGAVFGGRVVDPSKNPIPDVKVTVKLRSKSLETQTNSEGRFSLGGIDQDRVEVQFSKEGLSPEYHSMQEVGFLKNDLVMDDTTYLQGVIKKPDGSPIPNAKVKFTTAAKNTLSGHLAIPAYQATTDAKGFFRIYLQPDTYDIQAIAGEWGAQMKQAKLLKGGHPNLVLHMEKNPSIPIKITDSITGKPVTGVTIKTWPASDFNGISDENGQIFLSSLSPGAYGFQIDVKKLGYASWRSPQSQNQEERAPVPAGNNGGQRYSEMLHYSITEMTPPIEIILDKEATLRGRVLDPKGNPLKDVQVQPLFEKFSFPMAISPFRVITGKDGSFEMKAPASGLTGYTLQASEWKNFSDKKTWGDGFSEGVEVQPGKTRQSIEIRLTHPCIVRGRVTDLSGKPKVNQTVYIYSYDGSRVRYDSPYASTQEDGTFEFLSVSPGKHYVQASSNFRSPPVESEFLVLIETDPTKPVENLKLIVPNE